VINENLETIINNKQEIKDLKLKLDENIKILNSTQSNYKQLEFDKNIEITSYKQQVNIILIS
jgi:hypothetical protein